MLVTLLVIWMVVVPALTVAGAYVVSGILGYRLIAREQQLAERGARPERTAAAERTHGAPVRTQTRLRRSRDHVLIRR